MTASTPATATATADPAPASAPQPAAPAPRSHLYAVDVVRFLTVGGVIAVHSTSLTVGASPGGHLAAGVVLSVAHVTRSVFLFLTAFVLGHRYGGEAVPKRAFWRRRYLLVAVPYVVWSLVYVLADGDLGSPAAAVARFGRDLLTGGARFHLYFLLITFQLYAVFPWVLRWVRRARPWPLLGASAALQLAFTAGTHYWSRPPGFLGTILHHPGSWLWSYQLYVVAGILAALHLGAVTAWVRSHLRLIAGFSAAALAVAMASYAANLSVLGMSPVKASEVFQPSVVLVSAAAIAAQYALGLWVEARAGARWRRRLTTSSDVSFGVYLAHPLLLQGVLAATAAAGLDAAAGGLPPAVQLVLVIAVLVPAVYALIFAGAVLARRTPLSLALTGRRGRLARPVPRTVPLPTAGSLEPAVPSP